MPEANAVSGILAQAFRLLERTPISSFADDSEEAVAAADQYPVALDICLERADWSFASAIASLSEVVEPSPDPELRHVYQRPGDLVMVREMRGCAAWRLDSDRLRADRPGPIVVRYTRRVTDETRLPAMFKTAAAYRLASLLAARWTTSINRSETLREVSEDYLVAAARADRRSASGQRYDEAPEHLSGDWASAAVSRGGLRW